eukprot:jgi/Hompol1/5194/HPOL_004220-RA
MRHVGYSASAPTQKRTTIWNSPVLVLSNFVLLVVELLGNGLEVMASNLVSVTACAILVLIAIIIYNIDGSHQETVKVIEQAALWYGWWTGLGVLSSIGLGTGLHTFMLFLGPFIAQATLTAYSCQSLDFATRGPNSFVCPSENVSNSSIVSIWGIASKIRPETVIWGLGTAIGELPPYFVARAAAMAGKNDPDFASIEHILAKDPKEYTLSDRANIIMHGIVTKMGFFGILLCASVPNPLFDLAGIICGHFGVPFTTFFSATALGKAIIKSNLQALSIVVLFSKNVQHRILAMIQDSAPWLHSTLQGIFESQASKFGGRGKGDSDKASPISLIWNGFMTLMVLYFVISIIESLALSRMQRLGRLRQK